jgi:hypothetical protein
VSKTSNATGVMPLKKPRRALSRAAALEFLREKGVTEGHDGWLDFNGYAALGFQLRWEKSRTWKACQAWKGDNRAEVSVDEVTGQVSIRILPDRSRLERGKGNGISTDKKRGNWRGKTVAASMENLPGESVARASGARVEEVLNHLAVPNASFNAVESVKGAAIAQEKRPLATLAVAPFSSPEEAAMNTKECPPIAITETAPASPADRDVDHDVIRQAEWPSWPRRGRGSRGYDQPAQPLALLEVGVLIFIVALAGVAAWFSIHGMVALFYGTPLAAICMGAAIEGAKLFAVAALGRWSDQWEWRHRLTLMAFVVLAEAISAAGVYSQLVASHIGPRSAEQAAYETRDAEADGRIEVVQGRIADLDRRINQIDITVEAAAKRGRSKVAIDAMQSQQRQRADLTNERDQARKELASLKTDRTTSSAQYRAREAEAMPIMYVAEFLGIQRGGEEVIRWLIGGIVAVTDPFALALAWAMGARRRRRNRRIEGIGCGACLGSCRDGPV